MTRELRNVPRSVHQRLKNLAREQGTELNRLLERYAGERFLYRLGVSAEVDRFTLKGAALFLVWLGEELRATRDVDLLGTGDGDHEVIRAAMAAICAVPCPEDGLAFDSESIRMQTIRDEQEYGGVRVRLLASLGPAVLPLQVDIGFGDAITPEREEAAYPTLLDQPVPRLWTYPRETFLAEKFEAMVRLGPVNTRMKDFWDVAALAARFDFDGETLRTALDETFQRRGTTHTEELPDALRPAFYQDARRAEYWQAFLRKAGAAVTPADFNAVGDRVRAFLGPVRESLVQGEAFTRTWPANGPWQAGTAIRGGGRDG
jgi:hypothetical protein